MKPVALVSMPVASAEMPSYQLGLLTAILRQAGIPAEPFSLFVHFQTIGRNLNELLADVHGSLPGEWIWTRAAFGDFDGCEDYFRIFRKILHPSFRKAGCNVRDLLYLRNQVAPAFIDYCLRSIEWKRFGLIGFSISFQQILSSLALARSLKEHFPSIPVILGGCPLDHEVAGELMRGCPWIDLIHCGEAEITFPEIVRRVNAGGQMTGQAGLYWRDGDRVQFNGSAPVVQDLDSLPAPDYDEFFDARRISDLHPDKRELACQLPIETSRGCWWAARSPCTFCGLTSRGSRFRTRSAENAIGMMTSLSNRYTVSGFYPTDQTLPHGFVKGLFGKLTHEGKRYPIFYATRIPMAREEIQTICDAGTNTLGAGIESFSTHMLTVMNKGTRAIQNLEMLKWCRACGMRLGYNILIRLPGENLEDYHKQCELIPKIIHFSPPSKTLPVLILRGSPLFTRPELHSIRNLTPALAYPFLFPENRFNLSRIALYFDYESEGTLPDSVYEELQSAIRNWQQAWEREPRPFLQCSRDYDKLLINDGRHTEVSSCQYGGTAAELYEFCERPRTAEAISRQFGDAALAHKALREFVDRSFMAHVDEMYLSLATPQRRESHQCPREAAN